MSDTTNQNPETTEVSLPEFGVAREVILERVHKRAFIEKIAAIAPEFLPQNQEEFDTLLQIGHQQQLAAMAETQKTASTNRFSAALGALTETAVEEGLPSLNDVNNVNRLRKIAAHLASDPEIYDAALAIKIAEAEALEAEAVA